MASSLFDSGREAFLTGGHVWGTTATRLQLNDNDTVAPLVATHDFLDDIVTAMVHESSNFTYPGTSAANGIADAVDVALTAVTGATVESIVIFKETGVNSTSTLLVYIDTVSPAFPFTPNGGDVTITWDAGANKIFRI